MPEALSQSEIEALMMSVAGSSASAEGGAPPAPVRQKLIKTYDFRRPDKFSKEHLRALRNLHESYARGLASVMTSYLRTSVQVRLAEFEQTPYADYTQSLPNPTLLYAITLAPLPGQAVLQFDLTTGRAILERLLGGPGGPSSQRGELTEIELALFRGLATTLLTPLEEAWAPVYPLKMSSKDPVLSAEFVQVAMSGETTIIFVFEIGLFGMTGSLSLCIPHPVIHAALDDLASQVWSGAGTNAGTESERLDLAEQLSPVELPISVELGRAQITVRELVGLAPGQIVKLTNPASGPVLVKIAGRDKYYGTMGLVNANIGVRIVQAIA